jgi:hypothetical protein
MTEADHLIEAYLDDIPVIEDGGTATTLLPQPTTGGDPAATDAKTD